MSQAVPGLTFNTISRVLTGTPTTQPTTDLTYTVTDENGSIASATFSITVADGVALNAPNDQTYTIGQTITALTLPAATGGTGTLTYTLTGPNSGALPTGLSFDDTATVRTLTGTPTTQATTDLTYTVTDQNDSTASATFSITVADGVALTAPNNQTYTMGQTITALTLPAATGGTAPLTYTLRDGSGNAVPGLAFNTTARVLSGTPTTATTTVLTYTVTDQNGSTASDTFTVTVAAAVALTDTGNQFYTMGRPIPALTLPLATGGTGTLTYTLTGPASAALSQAVPGLTFNTTARVLSGTPTTAATTVLTYTVTDERGSTASDTVTLTVADGVALNAPNDLTYTMGRPIPALTLPAATGGTGTLTYTLRDGTGNDVDTTDNAVPGLIFNTISRVLTGTPTTAATTALTYTVTDEHGSTASDTLTLTVAAQVALNAPGDQTYTMGRPIPALTLSAATGGTGTLTYTLTGPASAALSVAVPGLTFTATTRVLSGTPTTATTTVLTYTVTDERGSTASDTVTVTVAAQVAVTAPGDQTYTMGQTITDLTLPAATGGTGTLTYTLTGPSDAALNVAMPGLTFNTTTRVLSGTPTTTATIPLTYTVTDENGSTASDTLTVTVAAQVAVTAPNDQTYTVDRPITALTLPAATGGTGDLTYILTGPGNAALNVAVPGLTFTATTRVLSGTPTTAATTALTYTVTDERGSTASDTVPLTVADGVALNAPNDLTYTMGRPIPALTLPLATGGTGTLTYTLTGPASAALSQAVPGLTFNTTARVLTGTPTTAATTVLTYTVTDERGSTASDTVTVTVADGVALNAPNDLTYTMGRPIPVLTLPAATGGTGTLTYTLRDGTGKAVDTTDNAVPGLIFNTISRVLTGTPTTAATTALTYTVTDQNGSTTSVTFSITVAAQVAVTAPGDQTYTMGRPITALTLPLATGGTGTLTYTLTGPASAALSQAVPGLTFNTTARVLSGTPTTATTTVLTYTVTDERGSTASDTVTVTVAAQVAVTAPGDQTYTMGQTITDLTLPAATGGTGTLTYTLRDGTGNDVDTTDNAVPGLIFNTISRVLTGTPTTAATTALTYTVTDEHGSTASDTVTLTVADGVALNAPTDQTYTMGRPITALTLPLATGGTGTLTYTLRDASGNDVDTTDNAVPGLTFNTASRVLSGTPTTAATTVLTYTVTDERGSTASDTVTVTVAAQVAVTAPTDQTYTMGTMIPALTLSTATGGTGTLTYTLTGPASAALSVAVPGLTFNPTARTLTGTPTTAATTALTYTVTDEHGSTASDTFDITVATGVALNAPNDQRYTMGRPITALTLPLATGGTGTLTYTLRDASGNDVDTTDNAVPGLTFNTTARVLSGTPTMAATTALTYTVTDQNGSTDSDTLTLTVAAQVVLNAPTDQTYTMGQMITALTLPPATGGTGTLTYTLTGPGDAALSVVVPGLTFDDESRTLSGTPTEITTSPVTLTYTATDEHGSTASDTFTVAVVDGVALNAPNDQTYTMGQTITDLTLSAATGGTGTLTYTLRDAGGNDVDGTDNAAPGLTFNMASRVLSGTPTETGTTELTYTVTDQNDSTASATFGITVAVEVAVTAPNDQTYTMGTMIPALTLPMATGGTGTLTYTLRDGSGNDVDAVDNAIPGLTFNTTSRVLSGTPTTTATTALTYTVTDERGSTSSATFDITVAAQVAVTAPNDQTYTMGQTITDLTLPAATGGTGTLTYTLRDGSGNDVDTTDNAVPGLIFNTISRVLTGTSTTAATTALTYTVTDEHGSTASATFTLTVADGVALNAPNDQTYTMGRPITALTLPLATGGTGTLTYTLRDGTGNDVDAIDNAVPGLAFDPSSRALSGTPTETRTTDLTYTVTDENGSTASATFDITVAAQVAVSAPTDQTYTMGRPIPTLTLPAATGGTGTLSYILTGPGDAALSVAIPGLTFNTTARVLSGTPTTAATTVLTYTVTDEHGSTASVTFDITVAAQVVVTAPTDQTYTMGRPITALTLPMASGGTGTLTYTLRDGSGNDVDAVDNAVPGLTFNTTTRVLSGTPTTTATTTLTYTVTDERGSTASNTFDITVATGVALNAPTEQTYTMGRPIPALTLPPATGGTGTLTYTLTGPSDAALSQAIPGLTFNTTSRVLSGTPTTTATTALTYTVTDERGSTSSATFDITVAAQVAVTVPNDQTYTMGQTITALTLPLATGGTGTLTYTLRDASGNDVDTTDNAVPGLTFNTTSRVLSGTPTTQVTTPLTYTVTDEHGSTASAGFSISVNEADTAPAFTVAETIPAQTYEQNTAITPLTLPLATGGNGAITYTLTGPNGMDVSELPTGLTYAATARTITGTPTATTAALTFTWTAADTDDNTAADDTDTLDLQITVNEAEAGTGEPDTAPVFAADATPTPQTYTVGQMIMPLTLPLATGGNGTLFYTLRDADGNDVDTTDNAVPGLAFDPESRVLSGTPTAPQAFTATIRTGTPTAPQTFTATTRTGTPTAPQTFTARTATTALTYTVTDDNGNTATLDFTLTVNEAEVPGTGEPNTAPTFAGAGIADQTYTRGAQIPDLLLPMATGGDGAITYTMAPLDELPDGLSFDGAARPPTITGTPTATTAPLTFTWTAADTDANNMPTDTVALDFSITVNAAGTFTALNKIILPEVARNMADSTVSSIARRVEQAKRASREAGLNLAGQSMSGQDNLAAALRTHGEAKMENSSDFKELLAGSDFVLPLNPSDGAGTNATSLALWGRGEYRDLSGERDGLSWEAGDLTGAHVGLDVRLGEDIVAGAAVSRLESNLRYTGYDDGTGGPDEGAYKLAITSAHPYIGWRAGEVDLWATVGYGAGELEITPQAQARQSSDVKLRTFGIGGNGEVWQGGPTSFRLKGEALRTALKVDGHAETGAAIERMDVAATRLRLTIEGRQSVTLANGGVFEPVLEMGVRYDSGDGETSGGEVGGGWRYHNPATRFTADGRLRALLGRSNYEEWGVQGSMALQPGADGQGVSFSLSPGYGDSTSGVQQLWRHGLAADATAGTDETDTDYAMKLDARMGYGVAMCTGETTAY